MKLKCLHQEYRCNEVITILKFHNRKSTHDPGIMHVYQCIETSNQENTTFVVPVDFVNLTESEIVFS